MRFSEHTFSMQHALGFFTLVILPLVLLMACLAGSVSQAEAGVTLQCWSDINQEPPDGKADKAGKYEYVLFGRYQQTEITNITGVKENVDYIVSADSPEDRYFSIDPIVWRVLSADQGGGGPKALLLSDKYLDVMAFDARRKSPANYYGGGSEGDIWSDYNNNYAYSQIREFLVGYDPTGNFAPDGGIFADAGYFSPLERGAVSADAFESEAERPGGSKTVAPPRTTLNPLFLLSLEQLQEAEFGFVDEDKYDANRVANATTYATRRGGTGTYYWTRSPVSSSSTVRIVSAYGGMHVAFVDAPGFAVRPALFLNLESVIFKSASDVSNPADGVGEISNPYVLYVASADVNTADISMSVNGNRLTVSFDRPVAHAWTDVASTDVPAGKFTVENNGTIPATDAAVANGKLVLTLGRAIIYNENTSQMKVSYNLDPANDTDGLGLPAQRITVRSLLGTGVTNLTPKPPSGDDAGQPNETPPSSGGGDDSDSGLSNETRPLKVTGVVSDERYPPVAEYVAQTQPDGVYLVLLPVGTDLSILKSLYLEVVLPKGATISPSQPRPFDFTDPENEPVKLVITAEDGSKQTIVVQARIAQPVTAEGTAVTDNPARCAVIATYDDVATEDRSARAGGTLTVEVHMPFAEGFDPAKLDGLSAKLSGLTGLSFARVDEDGNAVPLASQATGDPYLRIGGTAASDSALKSATLSALTYWLKGDATEYVQTFDPAMKFSDMVITYTNASPISTPLDTTTEGGSGGGCDAGFGALALICGAAVLRKRSRLG